MASRFKRQRAEASKPAPAAPAALGDEDDYLSASFVVEQPNAPRGKRVQQADPERGRVLSKKDIAKKMEDRREEGLQKKIGEENSGFKLLMKLGYKGGGLGKDGAGTANPLMPELKQGRAGLGKESETKRRKEEQKERARDKAAHDARHEVQRRQHFRLSKAAQFLDRRLHQDLSRARRLVESLDEPEGRTRSIMWPDEEISEDPFLDPPGSGYLGEGRGAGGERGGRPAGTALEIAASRVDADDGETPLRGEGAGEEGLGASGGLREEWDMMQPDEKLSACVAYLRTSHSYCMYCACKYSGPRDLQGSCPGPGRDDHDEEEL